jgi:hypothetical protein
MHASPTAAHPTRQFLLIAAAVIGGNALMVYGYSSLLGAEQAAPEWPVAVDLLVLLPLVYLWLYCRAGKRAWIGALSVLGVGVFVGSWIVPAESKQWWPWLEQGRWLLLFGVLLVQSVLLGLIARAVYRVRHRGNLETVVHAALEQRLGKQWSTGLLQLEARMWMYALLRDPMRQPLPGDAHFACHAQHGNLSNQQGFLILLAAEIPLLHLVLHLAIDPAVAWFVTVASIYGWIFLLAEYRATRLRSIGLDWERLYLRYGLVIDLTIPLDALRSVELCQNLTQRQPGRLRMYGMGQPNVRIVLHPDTRLQTLFGQQEVREIVLGVDAPTAFVQAIRGRLTTAPSPGNHLP